jgi:hypothetical protein
VKWRWRRHTNGEAARAGREANEQLRSAESRARDVDRTTRAAQELVRRTDYFAREVHRSLQR